MILIDEFKEATFHDDIIPVNENSVFYAVAGFKKDREDFVVNKGNKMSFGKDNKIAAAEILLEATTRLKRV